MKRVDTLFAAVVLLLAVQSGVAAQNSANDALFSAAKNGTVEDVKAALKAGADVNTRMNDGTSALILAAKSNENLGVVEALVEAGCDVNARGEKGWTALMYLAKSTNIDALNALIAAGANVNAKSKDEYTALTLAAHNTDPRCGQSFACCGSRRKRKGQWRLDCNHVGCQ